MRNGKWEVGSRKWNVRILLLVFNFLLLTSPASLCEAGRAYFSLVEASDPRDELKEVQKKLDMEKRKAAKTIKKEKSILSELERIDKALSEKKEEMVYYDNRLKQTRTKIRSLDVEVFTLNGKLEKRQEFLRQRLRSLYKQQRGDAAVILMSAMDYQNLIKKSRYISFIAYYDRKVMEAYSKELDELKMKMQEMAVLKKELEINKQKIKKKADEIQVERQKKDTLLASVKRERRSYEKMIKELEESSKRLFEMIKKLEKEEPLPPVFGKGFAALKGRLPWPVDGKILIPFGNYKDPQFNISVFKNGIEIQAGRGEAARAVYGGRVVYADWFKGYGQLLIINHGDGYHTLYAHLSEIFHEVGDIIKEYQPVGRVGESGILNVPSLYFEIRYKGKPINPVYWLRKK
ncbi:MAG: peptidoglycan DD-metalloendopeptidase family protein [Nitrospirae bacterium]|nr:peptidoglycan DD-metalloendopeptidase family protein [Nitrospirota bacterium]